jgi:tRNA dimethylallyltransferase
MNHHIIVVCGQTATGKSDLAVELALQNNGEVISCDSRQVYKGLDIGSNKITPEEMRGVPHHMLNITNPGDRFTVADFQKQAREHIMNIWARGKTPILCGGTGLYIDATVFSHYIFDDTETLTLPLDMTIEWIGLRSSRETILGAIRERALKNRPRVVKEIQCLLSLGVSRNWLHHLGLEYRYGIELIEGRLSDDEYIDILTLKTRQYARRQIIWFKRNPEIIWRDVE